MASPVIDLRSSDNLDDAVHIAVEALAAGKVLAVPTETVYGLAANANNLAAVEKLMAVKNRVKTAPLALAIKSDTDALDYAPKMSPLAKRLARRCLPGPITLVVDHGPLEESLVGRLPQEVQELVAPKGAVGFRVVAHPVMREILQYIAGPLVLTSANRTGDADSTTGEQVLQALGDDVDLLLDDGPCYYGQPTTVVQVSGNNYNLLREGVVGSDTMERLASLLILVVCTGNTCRSPMAEILLRKRVADKLGCNFEETEQHGVLVSSAGIAAGPGGRPSPEANQVLQERGLSLNGHLSQPVTDNLIRHADLILTMTRGHRDAIINHWPQAANRTDVLRIDQGDIADPIGGSVEVYRACAQQIDQELRMRIDALEF